MRWTLAVVGLLGLLMFAAPAAAEVVQDDVGAFRMEVADTRATICSAFPAPTDAGTCSEADLAFGRALSTAAAARVHPVRVLVAHFDGWVAAVIVMREEPTDSELSQRSADLFAGGLREGTRKQLPSDAHLIDGERPAHAELLRIGDLQVVRAIVKVERPTAPAAPLSQIVYQVVARDASYMVSFRTDLAHFDDTLAFAQRSIESVHAPPAPSTPPPGSDEAEYQRGKSWGLIFRGAVIVVLALTIWINRGWFKRGRRK